MARGSDIASDRHGQIKGKIYRMIDAYVRSNADMYASLHVCVRSLGMAGEAGSLLNLESQECLA